MPPYTDTINYYQGVTNNSKSSEQYQIRLMDETDLDAVVQIEQETWGDDSWPLKDFFKSLDDSSWYCWVLESTTENHAIVGYGLQYTSDDTSQHIANLTLHPDECGRGLGGILLRYMINYARQIGAWKITLEVNTLNARAYHLYAKHGFAIVEVIARYYSDSSDAYRMELPLYFNF